jgi:hypothetical protein
MHNCNPFRSRTIYILFNAFFMLSLPSMAAAEWDKSRIDTIVSQVHDISDTIVKAQGTISNPRMKSMIEGAVAQLQVAVDQQAGISVFLGSDNCSLSGNSQCAEFKNELIDLFVVLEDLNNTALNFHTSPHLNLVYTDPGLALLVENLPGLMAFPLYKVMNKLGLMDAGVSLALDDANSQLMILRQMLFAGAGIASPDSASISSPAFLSDLPDVCEIVQTNRDVVKYAAYGITGAGVITHMLGGLLKAFGETVFAGPVEMDAGIHGYVHGTIKSNKMKMIGTGISALGDMLAPIGSYGTNKLSQCKILDRQEMIMSQLHDVLDNQEKLLLGQRRTLCAFKNNIPNQCEEFVGNGWGNRGNGKP